MDDIDFFYAFQNEKRVFSAAHHAFKQSSFRRAGGTNEALLDSLSHGRWRFSMGSRDSQ